MALKDIHGRSSPILAKTRQLARSLDAEVCLFHAITEPVYIDSRGLTGQSMRDIERGEILQATKRLEAMAKRLRQSGLDVTTKAVWDYPSHESVVRAAVSWDANLVIADCYRPRHPVPWLMHFTDWELLRRCPVPVLLIKNRRPYTRKPILAAIDPLHAFSKPTKLDDEILRNAATLADAVHAPLHVVNAYSPMLIGMTPAELSATNGIKKAQKAAAAQAHRAADPKLEQFGVPRKRRHIIDSFPLDAIRNVSDKLGAQIVAMGAISRSGLKQLLIGNTAERMLDRLTCDVLIVKPRDFKARVARARRGPQIVGLPLVPPGF
ncbi:MAG: universal stress protein [Proteobacteria bacterium]|nr:universal stress protein [Pseudomonadota bacterium]